MPPKRLTRDESRARTRERLLDAAAELFAERGVNGASVEQIAEHAGFSRGAFYGNFADKHELVVALLKQRTEREIAEVGALRAASADETMDRLREWNVERALNLDGWFALRTELALYALRNPESRPMVGDGERLAREAVEAGVRHQFEVLGLAPPADPAFIALIVHSLQDGLLLQRFLAPDGTSDGVVVDAVQLVMRALAALSATSGR
ncbi:TetR/AcrR family transcriptional regulator [Amycolatopsis sp. cg5]|uniref:TetR/AcrR family transcriptional regulator n=1 Tax=Amycolatopsis sp. cg5 TaxID=3238802 RepID=UPI0035233ECD